jgi:hypothetical protein
MGRENGLFCEKLEKTVNNREIAKLRGIKLIYSGMLWKIFGKCEKLQTKFINNKKILEKY